MAYEDKRLLFEENRVYAFLPDVPITKPCQNLG